MSTDSTTTELHRQLFDKGLEIRKEVLGNDHVEKSLKSATPFTQPMQELITEWAWGNTWQRPGLDRKQRSLLTLGLIIGQNAWTELALHTRGAINNGLSEQEIKEAVLHAAVYCGTPSGNQAISVTQKVISDMIDKGEYKRSE